MPSPSTNGLIDPHLSAVPADRLFQQLSSTKPPVPHSPTIKPSIHSSITNNETGAHPSDCIEYLIYKLRLHYVPLYFSASCTEIDEIHSLKQRAIIYCDQLQLLLKGEFLPSRYSPAPGSVKYSLRKLHKAYNKLDQARIECDSIHRVTELWPEGAKIRARSKYKKALGEVVEFYEGKLHSLLKWVEKKEGDGDCRQLDPADDTLALNVVRDYWSKYFCQKPSRFEEHRYNALRYSLGSTIVQYNKDFFCGYHAKGIMASDKTDDVLGKLYEAINAPENILVEHESED